MRIKQIVNNNVVVSEDKSGEIIVIGKGIGFNGRVGEVIDPSKIEKTYVLQSDTQDSNMKVLLSEIPYEIVRFGIKATDYIMRCSSRKINRRIMIPLTDHIYACLQRKDIRFDKSIAYNVRFLYREEYKIAEDVVDMLNSDFDCDVDMEEAAFITLHIVNAQLDTDISQVYRATDIISTAVATVEEYFNIRLDNSDINFIRFVTHLQFFAKRMVKNTALEEEDMDINKHINLRYANEYNCAKLIGERIKEKYQCEIDQNEYTYLTIHIARLLR